MRMKKIMKNRKVAQNWFNVISSYKHNAGLPGFGGVKASGTVPAPPPSLRRLPL